MAKHPTYRIEFAGPGFVFENVKLAIIDRKPSDPHFFHIDKKPNGWLMLVTEGFLHEDEQLLNIDVIRQNGGKYIKPSFLVREGCPCPISIYTVLTAFHSKEFYHIDQLDDGTFRLAHTNKMFGREFNHLDVTQITFTREA